MNKDRPAKAGFFMLGARSWHATDQEPTPA